MNEGLLEREEQVLAVTSGALACGGAVAYVNTWMGVADLLVVAMLAMPAVHGAATAARALCRSPRLVAVSEAVATLAGAATVFGIIAVFGLAEAEKGWLDVTPRNPEPDDFPAVLALMLGVPLLVCILLVLGFLRNFLSPRRATAILGSGLGASYFLLVLFVLFAGTAGPGSASAWAGAVFGVIGTLAWLLWNLAAGLRRDHHQAT